MADILTQEEIDALLESDNKDDVEQKLNDLNKDIFTYLSMRLLDEYRYKNNITDKFKRDKKICDSIKYLTTIEDMINNGIKDRKFNIEHYIGYIADEITRFQIILNTLNKFEDNDIIFDKNLIENLDIIIDKIFDISIKQKCCKGGECIKKGCCSKRSNTKYSKKEQ